VETLRLADPISDALLYRKGRIGAALSLCEAIDDLRFRTSQHAHAFVPGRQAWTRSASITDTFMSDVLPLLTLAEATN